MQIKIPEALAAKLAGKSPEEILALLETASAPAASAASSAPAPAAAPAAPAAPASTAPAASNTTVIDFAALSGKLDGITARLDKVVTDAKSAAASTVAQALAGTGIKAPIGGTAAAADEPAAGGSVAGEAGASASMEWAKMKSEQRAEFMDDEKVFAAFNKARSSGKIQGYSDEMEARCNKAVMDALLSGRR